MLLKKVVLPYNVFSEIRVARRKTDADDGLTQSSHHFYDYATVNANLCPYKSFFISTKLHHQKNESRFDDRKKTFLYSGSTPPTFC